MVQGITPSPVTSRPGPATAPLVGTCRQSHRWPARPTVARRPAPGHPVLPASSPTWSAQPTRRPGPPTRLLPAGQGTPTRPPALVHPVPTTATRPASYRPPVTRGVGTVGTWLFLMHPAISSECRKFYKFASDVDPRLGQCVRRGWSLSQSPCQDFHSAALLRLPCQYRVVLRAGQDPIYRMGREVRTHDCGTAIDVRGPPVSDR